ncbi:MAG: hypothetical protein KU37_08940 [Sulfuricurvum sp. PC08-66]|nr:MAG: hypothetical protein KU37_08940 [Sulfuricurvum sp. PC08-66]
MSAKLTLVKLIQKEVLPEIEEYMDELFEIVASKEVTQEDKAELVEIQELHQEFKQMLVDLEADEIDEEECLEIIEEIKEMRSVND